MACKVHEEVEILPVIAPQAQAAAGNTTGTYLAVPARGHIDFVVRSGALASGKTVVVKVFQAAAAAGTDAAELTDYAVTVTGGASGNTEDTTIVSVNSWDVTKGYVTVKVSNTAAAAVPIDAFALVRKELCG